MIQVLGVRMSNKVSNKDLIFIGNWCLCKQKKSETQLSIENSIQIKVLWLAPPRSLANLSSSLFENPGYLLLLGLILLYFALLWCQFCLSEVEIVMDLTAALFIVLSTCYHALSQE